ncbi:selenide, water dikinase SelD [Pseudoruegeria sp. SK021]|uniref:selenide, water dikinase SelD n=1 Tax=Pseudoruegeria sp. SK021 TaxID=1933035 RepID=UPI000A24AEFE|nr:selenide, water dikinase SelD [Pseudoruegeria sp. SK021]OSP54516.1 selenide, water dikinase SelD [Pseudoruegeria sp. SK021]
MHMPLPLTRDLVLVGGGHTHALVLKRWAMRPLPGTRLTLIDPQPAAAYSGMLPGHVAGHYSRQDLEIDLVRLARMAGARLILDAATGLDRAARKVLLAGRAPVAYDVASIDIGITSAMPDLPGFADHAVPAKPLGPFAARWRAFTETGGQADGAVVVIGAGVAGVELAMAMAHRLRQIGGRQPKVTLIEAHTALAALRPPAQARLRTALDQQGITLLEQRQITHISANEIHLADGQSLSFDFCTGTAGTRPHNWLASTGLPLTDGFVDVGADLCSTGDPAIYAVGDCAHLTHAPRPKAGVFAVREAPILDHNLRADLTEGARRSYWPQRDYLKLISLGERAALVEKGPVTLAAPWLWRLKDRIDRRFMDQFRQAPAMPAPPLPDLVAAGVHDELAGGKPLCGGCGSKVGAGTLHSAIDLLPPTIRTDILSAPGDDAAVLDIGGQRQVLTTDHLRAVTDDPWLMAQIAAHHALGDVWAMGATPQCALSSLILPPLSAALQARTLHEITRAAADVFRAAGADIVGGHTTLGAELTIGFTVTGLVPDRPLTLAGARPGDALILTRPIGSGVLLAAEMQGRAEGRWMAALYRAMTKSQGPAAAILAPVAHAMTDITGFGLAGHVLGMADASGTAMTLNPAALPLYDGAADLAAAGLRSSLFPSNRDHVLPRMFGFDDSPQTDLLFDPQTCGGLLAAVPKDQMCRLLAELEAQGLPSHHIGDVEPGPACLHRRAGA